MRALRVYLGVALVVRSAVAVAQPADGETDGSAAPPPAEPSKPAEPASATTGTIEGIVEAPDLDAPLAGAVVHIVGTDIEAKTDDEGHFTLQSAPGVVHVRADFTGFRSEERVVNVPAGAKATLDFKLVTAPLLNETIVVVGSRTPRTNVETTVPVDVITADDIARSGRTETGRILNNLEASFLSVPQTIADGTDHVDPASLRGLGPDQVLVLVNGKRRHRSALLNINGTFGRGTVGTDLNAFPSGAIKRIEVLRDGAASQYGSDAIAGVINIVTKDTTDVVDISSEAGVTASRDGAQLLGSANYGYKIGDKGYINVTGQFLQRNATNRSGTYTGPVYSNDNAADNAMLAANGKTRADFGMRIGEAAVAAGMGEYDLEIPFGDGATFYSFGDLSHRRGDAGGFYRFPYQESQNVPEFYANGFLPLIRPTMDDQSVTVGLKRKGTWDVDASLTYGQSNFKFDIDNTVNASLGTASPTTFDAGTLTSSETTANLDLLHNLKQDALKSVAIVLGSEVRVENYQIHAGDEASYSLGTATFGDPPQPKLPGAQVFPGFQPSNEVDRTRDSVGVYGGVETEINKALAVDAGGRYEHYSDFGSSLIGKIAARLKIVNGLALRGALSTGFRAPSLQQLWFSNVATQFLPDQNGNLQATQVLTSNNESPVTKAFGIPKLHEEKSTNVSGGVAWRPLDNLSFTADGYFIRIDDRIVLTSTFANTNATVAEILAPFPSVSQAQFFANAVNTNTEGIDLVADWVTQAGPDGVFTLTGAANFTKTEVTDVNLPSSLVQKFGADTAQLRTFFFGRNAQNRLEDAVPHQKGFVSARYAIAGISALVRADYYGKVYYKADNPANDETFGAKVLFDVDFGYQLAKTIYFGVGADNLFNTFPDRQTKDANISFGRFLYSRNVSQFGMNGGFYYGKLQLTF
ncbi:MAG: TonB-dependent receptor [Kofleriaceae bacterium]